MVNGKVKIKLATIFILSLFFVPAHAEIESKYASEFISGAVDARTMSLGGYITTSFNDANAIYYNPAYLPHLTNQSIAVTHSERFDGLLQQEYIGYTHKWQDGEYLGIALLRLGVDDIPITAENPDEFGRAIKLRSVANNEGALYLAYSRLLKPDFSVGANAKLLFKSFEEASAYGLGFDVAAHYKFNEKLFFASKIQDITTSLLAWSTNKKEYIRPSLYLNGEFNHYINYFKADAKLLAGVKVAAENYQTYAYYNIGQFDVTTTLGLELLLKKVVFLRGGLNNDQWSAGSGLTLSGFNLDYAFKPHNEELGDTHQVSLSYNW